MRGLVLALVVSCGAPKSGEPTEPARPLDVTPSAELSAALTPLAWLLGDWTGAGGGQHWVAAGGAIYGVALQAGDFTVRIIDDGEGGGPPDGVLRLYSMPAGKTFVDSRQRGIGDLTATFDNGEVLQRKGDALSVAGTTFTRAAHESAPELETADRTFAADTAKRGVDGWLAAFDVQGGMGRRGQRIDYAGIADAMRPVLGKGTLSWDPVASGKRGDIGFTVGKATFTGPTPEDSWRSTYVTIWRRQSDGSWKVLFDTGRPVQKSPP